MTRRHLIYFLQRADGLIKIGTTTNLDVRLAALTASHGMLALLRVINGTPQRERSIHRKFRRFHEYGEWFRDERGALTQAINDLPEGDLAAVAKSSAKAEWIAGEAAFMADVRDKVEEMIGNRVTRCHLGREAAVASLNADYGFSKHFLMHLWSGRATTISGYGFKRLRDAHLEELQASLAYMKAELERVSQESDDEDILRDGDRLEALAAKIAARRAGRQPTTD